MNQQHQIQKKENASVLWHLDGVLLCLPLLLHWSSTRSEVFLACLNNLMVGGTVMIFIGWPERGRESSSIFFFTGGSVGSVVVLVLVLVVVVDDDSRPFIWGRKEWLTRQTAGRNGYTSPSTHTRSLEKNTGGGTDVLMTMMMKVMIVIMFMIMFMMMMFVIFILYILMLMLLSVLLMVNTGDSRDVSLP